jgi:plasmid stabilization system protein ParE
LTRAISFHSKVFEEVEAIVGHYVQNSGPNLAMEFIEEFLRGVNLVACSPLMYVARKNGLRRVNLRKFPYNILFFVTDTEIRIQVVRHHARRPSYGSGRK